MIWCVNCSLQLYLQRFLLKMVCIGLKLLLSPLQAHCSVFFVLFCFVFFVAAVIDPAGSVSRVRGISDGLLCLQWILWQL